MKQIDDLNLPDAKKLLRDMRRYSDMSKKLGLRGKELFMKTLLGKKSLKVEYFPALGEEGAWTTAQGVFSRSFDVAAKKEEVQFIQNPDLKGGMKVYCDDNMVDISYKKIENMMQK